VDEQALKTIQQHRADTLLTLQLANGIIAKHKSSQTRIAGASKELETLAATQAQYRKGSGPQPEAPSLREMARQLREGIIAPDDLAAQNDKDITHLQQEIVRVP
jgi:hypothetical protein